MGRKSNENFENERKGAETKCRKDQERQVKSKNTHMLPPTLSCSNTWQLYHLQGEGQRIL